MACRLFKTLLRLQRIFTGTYKPHNHALLTLQKCAVLEPIMECHQKEEKDEMRIRLIFSSSNPFSFLKS
jgi:hypothetical protein